MGIRYDLNGTLSATMRFYRKRNSLTEEYCMFSENNSGWENRSNLNKFPYLVCISPLSIHIKIFMGSMSRTFHKKIELFVIFLLLEGISGMSAAISPGRVMLLFQEL